MSQSPERSGLQKVVVKFHGDKSKTSDLKKINDRLKISTATQLSA